MINKYFLAKMNIPAYLKKFLYERYGYTEIEGIPPIIFQGIGENLLDYRIDGANGGVGDKTSNLLNSIDTQRATANGVEYYKENGIYHLIGTNTKTDSSWVLPNPQNTQLPVFEIGKTYTISVSGNMANNIYIQMNATNVNTNTQYYIANVSNTNPITHFTIDNRYLKTSQIFVGVMGTATNVDSEFSIQIVEGSTTTDYEPYGYKVPVVISGKNLFYGTIEQGSFSAAGLNAASSTRVRSVEYIPVESSKTYTLSLNVDNNKNVKIGVSYYNTNDYTTSRIGSSGWISNPNNKFIFTIPNNITYIRFIVAYNNDNSNISPSELTNIQIEEGNIATDYEPYHEPTTTNIYLDEPIEENESISLSDTNTNIPTIRGTNILTVDTTVQPSNVYIKVGGE